MNLSIVIVSYNTKEYLKRCLESLEKNNKNLEILVIDNASFDGTVNFIKGQFPKLKLIINKENLGFAKAVNIGIKESTSKYIFLLNPDTEILRDNINKLVNFMETHPNVAAVGPKLVNSDLSLQTSAYFFPDLFWPLFHFIRIKHLVYPNRFMKNLFSKFSTHFWEHNEIREVDWITGAAILLRKEVILDIGLFDENFFMFFEEIDWCRRAKLKGWKIYFFPFVEIIHHLEKSVECEKEKSSIYRYKSMIYYYKKYYGKFGEFYIKFLLRILRKNIE